MTINQTQFLLLSSFKKILVGNYEPIIGIYGKIFRSNLRNLQMLFML